MVGPDRGPSAVVRFRLLLERSLEVALAEVPFQEE
jgi:hypothetical protein